MPTVRKMVETYASMSGVDKATADAVIAVLEAMPDYVPREKPRERLAYCTLEDVVRFQEANV